MSSTPQPDAITTPTEAAPTSAGTETTVFERVGLDEAAARAIDVRIGGIGSARAIDIAVSQGGVGIARADRVSVELGGIGIALADQVQITQGGATAVVGREVSIEQAFVRTVIAQNVTVRRPTGVLVLLAQRVDGDVRALLDWRAALAFGAASGAAFGLVRGLASRRGD